jgi:hypothetical protein
MQSSKKIKIGQLDTSKLISANYTASNNDNLIVNATCTITDVVSPEDGSNYEVTVVSGNVTIGGVVYTVGNCVKRVFNDSAWQTIILESKPQMLKITSNFNLNGSTTAFQKILGDSGVNEDGSFNCVAGKEYKIEGIYRMSSINNGGFSFGGITDGVAEFSNIILRSIAYKTTALNTIQPSNQIFNIGSFTNLTVNHSASTAGNGFQEITGTFTCTVSGKLYPAVAFSVNNNAVVQSNSWFLLTQIN